MTIILTTHYLEEAEHLSDKVVVMSGGKIVAKGTPEEIKSFTNTDSFEEAFIKLSTQEAVK